MFRIKVFYIHCTFFSSFFLAFDFCSAWSFGLFIHATTVNDLRLQRISIPFLILILEKEPVFPFSMLSAKQGNYWYHFYNVFGIRGPWLGIEPRTSRTRCQHSTTRLSRRRYSLYLNHQEVKKCPITSTTLILTNENRSEFCACLIINIVLRR